MTVRIVRNRNMKDISFVCAFSLCSFFLPSVLNKSVVGVDARDLQIKPIRVQSSAFDEGALIPKQHTADGSDLSPPLAWSAVPSPKVKSLVLICVDPDAPGGDWYHWIMFNIPAKERRLPQGMPRKDSFPDGTQQGLNDFGNTGYNGPSPPAGSFHHYKFKLLALDTRLSFSQPVKKVEILNQLKGHVVAEGQLTGVYKR